MSRTLIVGAAPAPASEAFYSALLAEYDTVVAADAAGEWAVSLGRVPDVTVGDFDSAAPGAADRLAALGVEVVAVSPDKDESDLELCVAVARRAGARDVCFTAAFSERLDHTLCALGSVIGCADLNALVREPSWSAWTVGGDGPGERVVDLTPGTIFSLIAPAGAVGVTLQGGKYPLVEGVLEPLSSLGLGNVVASGRVCVSVREGTLLLTAQAVREPA